MYYTVPIAESGHRGGPVGRDTEAVRGGKGTERRERPARRTWRRLGASRGWLSRGIGVVAIVSLIQVAFIQALSEPDDWPASVARADVVAQTSRGTPTAATRAGQSSDPRYFAETGFSVASGAFYDFFRTHGGARTFGPPISNRFQLLGGEVQIFRNHALVLNPDGTVETMGLLDMEAVPSLQAGGRLLPTFDDQMLSTAPEVDDPNYPQEAQTFIQANVPDSWNGLPVGFYQAFLTTVTPQEAGVTDPGLLANLALEVWGLPVSGPTQDQVTPDRVYLRWDQGVTEYDRRTGQVQPVPLGELFKAVLTGENLPPDLAAEATSSPFYRQFSATSPNGVARPAELPDTTLLGAFQASAPAAQAAPPPPPPQAAQVNRTVTPTARGTSSARTATPRPTEPPERELGEGEVADTCHGDERISIVPENPRAGDELLVAVSSSGEHPYPRLAGTERSTFVRDRPGQLGTVWEWTIDLTYPGKHEYTFYVDSTIPCIKISFSVRQELTTPTPEPPGDNEFSSDDNFSTDDNFDTGDNEFSENQDTRPPIRTRSP